MARIGISQPSFVSGELTPRLYGRTDYARYDSGAEAIENFIVRPEGGLIRRHGTRFLGESKDSTRKCLLVPFVVSTIQPYMLEFGNLYLRFWKNNAPIVSATRNITAATKTNPVTITVSGGTLTAGQRIVISGVGGMGQLNNREFVVAGSGATVSLTGVNGLGYDTFTSGGTASVIYELVTVYTEADLDTLFTTQSADTLYLVQQAHAPQTLVRVTDINWTFGEVARDKGPWATLNSDDTKQVFCTVSGVNYDPGDSVTIDSNADIFEAGHAGSYFYMEEMHFSDKAVFPYGTERANNAAPPVGTQYSNDGKVYECVRSVGDQLACQKPPVHEIGEAWDAPSTSNDAALWRYLHSRWSVISLDTFVNSKQMTGTIKTYLATGFTSNQRTVDSAVVGTNGRWRLTDVTHQYSVGDYVKITGAVGATGMNGSWRVINTTANTYELEGSIAGGTYTAASATAVRYATFLWRHSAFSTARGWPRTIAIHEQRLCYANTTLQPFGFWASMAGDYNNHYPGKQEDDEAISYNIASNNVDPIRWLMSANHIIFGTLSGELAAYGGGLGDPITPSNTRIVPQSGEGSSGVHPEKAGGFILFVNRAGRKLYALTFQSDVDQFVASDLIEAASHLTVGRTVVHMAWAKNPLSVLWMVLSDGLLVSMTYRPEQQLIAWARHPLQGGFVENVAVIPSQDGTTDDAWLVVRRTINGVTKRYIERIAAPFEPTTPTDKAVMGFVDCAINYTGAAASTFSGLMYLEGQTLQVVANGARHPDRVVTNGKITLTAPATSVWAGLGYTSRLRTLRPEHAGSIGTSQGKTKRTARLTVRVMNAIGGKAGPYDESVMDAIVTSEIADPTSPTAPFYSGDLDVRLASDYGLDGRVSIVQDEPMPLDVLSIMPLVTTSE